MVNVNIKLNRFLYRIREYHLSLYLVSIMVGVIGGLGAVIFRWLISLNQSFFSNILIIFSPALGGLIAGFLAFNFAPEVRGHGVPEVMLAIKEHFGIIRKRVALIKVLASSITIGSGGSAGREGPIAQIGAGVGSIIGQFIGLKPKDLKILTVAGLVAGISGTFNAPLGALVFGFELMLPSLEALHLISLILASVTGKIVATLFLGDYPAFIVPEEFSLSGFHELRLVILIGLALGLIVSLWVKLFYWIEELFEKLPLHGTFKPMIGGFIVGLLAFTWPNLGTVGVGYEVIERYMSYRDLIIEELLTAGLLKMVATMFTIGSGGSGGIFSPSLVIGCTLGSAFSQLFSQFSLNSMSDPRTYSLIGMAIVFTAVAKAPLTTLVMIPEMTKNYNLFLPIMVGNSIAYIISLAVLGKESIYTIKVKKSMMRMVKSL